MLFSMSKIHWIIDNIDQFVAQNRRTMEEPKEVLTLNVCCINSRDLTSLELSPDPHMFYCRYETKLFFEEIYELNILRNYVNFSTPIGRKIN